MKHVSDRLTKTGVSLYHPMYASLCPPGHGGYMKLPLRRHQWGRFIIRCGREPYHAPAMPVYMKHSPRERE